MEGSSEVYCDAIRKDPARRFSVSRSNDLRHCKDIVGNNYRRE
jgi:hypothetical protein